eukprot:CAMPEP_0206532298 /NCGR_PEP_ID=MMETSP0325_2-20121206/4283_1 /ASSEMBLY_ACC=CAM_ASM_000347 /TAXON_ID=2866 /ORGANISM="Crypthecodinium cohnii, Strain Seligo" /LENGTH=263 /DNA_ID=CAMNT_0054028717 /DNA_START=9 /DNA_END=797 /DNA_ORIENTATION=+
MSAATTEIESVTFDEKKIGTEEISECFLWTEAEAQEHSRCQGGASNCGATALLNVLAALNLPQPEADAADKAVKTNLRKHNVSLSAYLAARSVAGTTGEDIVEGCALLGPESALVGRFFPFYPPRKVNLQTWLAGWLSRGCSAIATMNFQKMYGSDAWHHQMIYGVSDNGVYATNGQDVFSYEELLVGLESPSILAIRAADVLRCDPFDAECCDGIDSRWRDLAVCKQCEELKKSKEAGEQVAAHVFIPAAYTAGIAIFAPKD